MSQVFISYARKDLELVGPFYEIAKQREKDIWIDWHGIYPIEDFMQKIYFAIESADACAFMLSPNWLASKSCRLEFEHALRCNKRLIPLRCSEAKLADVPPELAKLNWITLGTGASIHETLEKVYLAVDTDLEWVRAHTRLLRKAIDWDARDRHRSYCLRGRELREFEEQVSQLSSNEEPAPTSLQRQFLLASRSASSRNLRLVIASLSSAVALVTLLAVVACFMFLLAERRRKFVTAQQLASRSRIMLAERADRLEASAQTAVDAVLRFKEIGETSLDADLALQQAAGLLPIPEATLQHSEAVWDISIDRAGKRLACRYHDLGKMPTSWRPASSEETPALAEPNRLVPIWDLSTGERIREIETTQDHVLENVMISHHGRMVLVTSADGFEIWDIDEGRRVTRVNEPECRSAAFTDDDLQIVLFAKTVKFYSVKGELIQDLGVSGKANGPEDFSLTDKYLVFEVAVVEEAMPRELTPENVELLFKRLEDRKKRQASLSIWRKRHTMGACSASRIFSARAVSSWRSRVCTARQG